MPKLLPKQNPMTIENATSPMTAQAQKCSANPIAIFDSGVGGLSIAQCISQHLPNENLLYVADTLHAPYGEQSPEFIQYSGSTKSSQWLIGHKGKSAGGGL